MVLAGANGALVLINSDEESEQTAAEAVTTSATESTIPTATSQPGELSTNDDEIGPEPNAEVEPADPATSPPTGLGWVVFARASKGNAEWGTKFEYLRCDHTGVGGGTAD